MNLWDCGGWIGGRDNDAEREERQAKNGSVDIVRGENESAIAFGEAKVSAEGGG